MTRCPTFSKPGEVRDSSQTPSAGAESFPVGWTRTGRWWFFCDAFECMADQDPAKHPWLLTMTDASPEGASHILLGQAVFTIHLLVLEPDVVQRKHTTGSWQLPTGRRRVVVAALQHCTLMLPCIPRSSTTVTSHQAGPWVNTLKDSSQNHQQA